jgi:hypothetical protein
MLVSATKIPFPNFLDFSSKGYYVVLGYRMSEKRRFSISNWETGKTIRVVTNHFFQRPSEPIQKVGYWTRATEAT